MMTLKWTDAAAALPDDENLVLVAPDNSVVWPGARDHGAGSATMSENSEFPVTYDAWGRMKFHPDYHGKQRTPWTTADEKYLIENYKAVAPEQVSLALERTIHTVMVRACELRKAGRMAKPPRRTYTKRFAGTAILEAA